MKAWEICKEENIDKVYIDNNREEWKVVNVNYITGYIDLYSSKYNAYLTEKYYVNQINELDFEEKVDWSKVPVDTKVLVSHYGDEWCNRHFARYEDGKIYCFNGGGTSWTRRGERISSLTDWEYAKIYKEGEE